MSDSYLETTVKWMTLAAGENLCLVEDVTNAVV